MNIFFKNCLNLISFFIFCIPRKFLRGIGALLGVLWFDILRFRRKIIIQNLDIAFPEMNPQEKVKIGRQSVYQLGSNFLEFFTLPMLTKSWVEENAVYEGVENIQAALKKNKGVYLLSMHVGSGDMGASLISMLGIDVYLISKFFKTAWFNNLWFYIRKGQGVKFIEPHGRQTPFEILKAIKNKACVIFVLDQFMGKPYGVETSFFGKKTGTAYGLALFYLKTKSPVVPVYTFEGKDGKVHLVFEPELELENLISEGKDKTIADLTQNFTDQIEKIVRRYPDQWMWVHRRWKVFE
ncbi:MAG: lipid A biosynthesis lauroyl acyltransferase [Bdellovibrionota bacterium]